MLKPGSPLYERYYKPIDMSTLGDIFPTLPAPYDYVLNPGSKDTYHIEIVLPRDIVFEKVKTMDDISKVKLLKVEKPKSIPIRTRSVEVPPGPGPTIFLDGPGPKAKPVRG